MGSSLIEHFHERFYMVLDGLRENNPSFVSKLHFDIANLLTEDEINSLDLHTKDYILGFMIAPNYYLMKYSLIFIP